MGRLTRAVVATAAIALAGGLVACGSTDPESESASGNSSTSTPSDLGPVVTAPTQPAAGPITDPAALRTALLTAADLPVGFVALPGAERSAEDSADGSADDGSGPQPTTNPTRCANVLDTIARQARGAVAAAESNFSGPGFTSIDVDAASFPGTGAAEAFSTVQTTMRQCTAYTGTDGEGVVVDYRIEPLATPTIGDASTAIRLVTTSDGFSLVSDAVVAVVDSTVVQVVATGPEPVDAGVLEGLARGSAERIRAAAPSN
ncbi:hypothetical protein LCL87_13775 [Rhodococcus hoagii]|nr:hypothetical protein [Prescottella equi]